MNADAVARDYMTREVITLAPDMDVHRAIKVLVGHKISGAPVLDTDGNILGILSTRDCLKVAFSASYHQDTAGPVSNYMSGEVETVDARTRIVELVELFLKSRYRRFPVTENGHLIGLISRYDALRALEDLW